MKRQDLIANLRLPNVARRARQGRRSALARACAAAPGLRVHDAFAGWGTDGLVLASLGCRVHMSESSAAVYEQLKSRLADQAFGDNALTHALEDARSRWREPCVYDVIYMDPMFGRHPKTARPAKHMQVLAELAHEVVDIATWIDDARGVATARVVVKRRASAEPIGRPDWRIAGRSVRFDVYRPARRATAVASSAGSSA